MEAFTFRGLRARVVFGFGTLAQVADEAEALGARRLLVLSTPQQAAAAHALAERLGALAAGVFARARMHTPTSVTEEALGLVQAEGIDGTVALGGGSTIGLGKAIAYRTDLPQIAVPTTYAGSEATPILGQTEDGRKTTVSDPRILPETILYDVELTYGLPGRLSAVSGLNAIAHAVEALYARDGDPVTSMLAAAAITALAEALPVAVERPHDRRARAGALYGAWLGGTVLGSVGMALHHKLCHTLGGSFELPHAETHAVVLPHAVAFNAPAVPDAMERIARALVTADPARSLYELAGRLGAPRALRDLGMPASGIERAADLAVQSPYWNPRPFDRGAIRDLIARAWAGEAPAASRPSLREAG